MSVSPSGTTWGSAAVGWFRSLCLSASAEAATAALARLLAPAMPSASLNEVGDRQDLD